MTAKHAPQQQVLDPQRMIIDMCLKQYLSITPGREMIITHEQMVELSKFTLRLEVMDVANPATSPIKCSLITIAEAETLMEELKKTRTPR